MSTPPPIPERRRNALQAAIFMAVAFSLTLVLGELAIRLVASYKLIYNLEMVKYAKELKMPDPEGVVSHVHRPNRSARLMGVDVTLNSMGNRSPELSPVKAPGSRRIFVLGSSLTLGWGVTVDRIFTSLIEQRLNADKPLGSATSFEVVNSGIGNYNTYFQNRLFHRQYPRIKPDVVVLNYFVSDVEPRGRGRNNPILKYSYLAAYFFDRFAILKFSLDKTFSLFGHYEALYQEDSVPWRETREQVADMRDTAARDAMPFVIAIIPDIHDLSRGGPYGPLYGKIERQFLAMNIPTANMFGAFQEKFGDDVSTLWVQRDDPHPNELGHALIADELYRFLVAQPFFRGKSQ